MRSQQKYVVMAVRPVPLSCPVMTNPEYMDSPMPVGNAETEADGTIRMVLFRPIPNTAIYLNPLPELVGGLKDGVYCPGCGLCNSCGHHEYDEHDEDCEEYES